MTDATFDLPAPRRALAVGAHPDDIEFGAGGTLARWARNGTEIHLLVLTDGAKGTWDADDDLVTLVTRREAEARAAAATLGRGAVHFLGLSDGDLESGRTERELVCRIIREVRPDVLLGHDPWQRYRLHPDHRHAGWLTVDGVVAARDPHFFPGVGGAHHRPDRLLLFEADEPNHFESIEATCAVKVDALLCHRSQWRSTMGIDEGSPEEAEQRRAFARRVEDTAARAGARGGTGLAEAFRRIDDL
jgi:LmbE family N-acetylglucosaminyl deacetylase